MFKFSAQIAGIAEGSVCGAILLILLVAVLLEAEMFSGSLPGKVPQTDHGPPL